MYGPDLDCLLESETWTILERMRTKTKKPITKRIASEQGIEIQPTEQNRDI